MRCACIARCTPASSAICIQEAVQVGIVSEGVWQRLTPATENEQIWIENGVPIFNDVNSILHVAIEQLKASINLFVSCLSNDMVLMLIGDRSNWHPN